MATTNELRAKRAKNYWSRGGDLIIHGGTDNFLDGGDSPFMGCGPPHPPMLGTPDKHEKNPQNVVVGWFQKIVAVYK